MRAAEGVDEYVIRAVFGPFGQYFFWLNAWDDCELLRLLVKHDSLTGGITPCNPLPIHGDGDADKIGRAQSLRLGPVRIHLVSARGLSLGRARQQQMSAVGEPGHGLQARDLSHP